MRNLQTNISRSIVTLAVAGIGMALSPSTANAAAIVFSVEEGVVPGANNTDPTGTEIDATDNIEGQYGETLTLTPSGGPCPPGALACGSFDAQIAVNFSDYNLGAVPLTSQIGAPVDGGELGPNCVQPACGGTELYSMYGLVDASGDYALFSVAGQLVYIFTPTSSQAEIYLDPDRGTLTEDGGTIDNTTGTADLLIMTASSLSDPSTASVFVTAAGAVTNASFTLTYDDPTLVGLGPAYWPDLATLTIRAQASGQVHPATSVINPTGASTISGSVNLSFLEAPEPASMALLGMVLFGTGIAARRRIG